MEKTCRSLEINVISAEDLRLHRRSLKKNAFVIVQTDPLNQKSTSMDTEGGSYPSWNQKLNLSLPNSARFITVEVQCKTSSGTKTVGTAQIPVSDFIGDYTPPNYLHFLSYRLRESGGERNGIINLSIRVVVPEYVGPSRPPQCGVQAAGKNAGGVALGVPVSYGYGYRV